MKSDQSPSDRESFMILASGRIRCSRCQALSKRTKRPAKMAQLKEIERIVSKWYPDIAK